MKIVTTCPVTSLALYVSDVKPSLLKRGAPGDWGYSPKAEQAVELTVRQTKIAISDMTACGRKPKEY